jgi:N6-L-threonylcarbamoyladenine synthase
MLILGIETSCDETAAALVRDGTKILSNVVASSVELHQKTGGIIPEVAAREQLKCMLPVIQQAVQNAKCKVQNLDAIAVTNGPGLIGSLLVGVETAKTLAYVWNKPLIPINHLQAHLYANWLAPENIEQTKKNKVPEFPAVGLVVSGGHTDLVLMKNHGQIKWLGGTRDDAAGECFDKAAKVLNLGYPGGPAISAEAEKLKTKNLKLKTELPRPMIKEENFDFSFSGLKTAVINLVKKQEAVDVPALAFEIQEAITDVLVAKTIRAAQKYQVKSILLAGGVAANSRLREKFKLSIRHSPFVIFQPPPRLCTDNAAYIAACAYFNQKFVPWEKVKVEPGLRIC